MTFLTKNVARKTTANIPLISFRQPWFKTWKKNNSTRSVTELSNRERSKIENCVKHDRRYTTESLIIASNADKGIKYSA